MTSQMRRDLIICTAMEVLLEQQVPLPAGDVVEAVAKRADLNERELSLNPSGNRRFDTFVRFAFGWPTAVGWITKGTGGWQVMPAGREAFDRYRGSEFLTELSRRYR